MQIDRLGIHIGGLTITFFGLLLILALLVGGYLSMRAARRRDENPEHVIDGLTWAVIWGVIGARLFHVFALPPSMVEQGLTTAYYLTHPFDLQTGPLAIWAGGLNVLGALAGGMFGLWIYTRRQKLNFPVWADIAGIGAPLGIAIGSLGNLVHGQMLGPETSLPWGITQVGGSVRFHPLPGYLSIWAALVVVVLQWLEYRYGKPLRPGSLFLWFVVLLSPGLFLFEVLRVDKRVLLVGLSGMQVVAILAFAGGLVWLASRRQDEQEAAQAA
jgi:phosphatidylglycerol:prolipoprotein diacylglycerol transferase